MPDNIVFPLFLFLSIFSLVIGSLSGYFAYRNSHLLKNEMKMISWSIISIGCLVFGGLIWAWFLIPIIINHL
ncbi:MAG: hypothetical protein WDA22_10450 [Bacteroidota bacterium]